MKKQGFWMSLVTVFVLCAGLFGQTTESIPDEICDTYYMVRLISSEGDFRYDEREMLNNKIVVRDDKVYSNQGMNLIIDKATKSVKNGVAVYLLTFEGFDEYWVVYPKYSDADLYIEVYKVKYNYRIRKMFLHKTNRV